MIPISNILSYSPELQGDCEATVVWTAFENHLLWDSAAASSKSKFFKNVRAVLLLSEGNKTQSHLSRDGFHISSEERIVNDV